MHNIPIVLESQQEFGIFFGMAKMAQTFGAWLRAKRGSMTLEDFAPLFGSSRSSWADYEADSRMPNRRVLSKLREAYSDFPINQDTISKIGLVQQVAAHGGGMASLEKRPENEVRFLSVGMFQEYGLDQKRHAEVFEMTRGFLAFKAVKIEQVQEMVKAFAALLKKQRA